LDTSDRLERLLALLLIRETKTQSDKIMQLSVAGFTPTEIADLLLTSSAVVNQTVYAVRKGKNKKKKNAKS